MNLDDIQLKLKSDNPTYGKYNNAANTWDRQIPSGTWALDAGEVFLVNEDDYSCWVITDKGKDLPRVSCASPWFSFSTGAGMYHMPEANSRVIVGQLKNGEWVILGYLPLHNADEEYSRKNGRRDLQQGDMCWSTDYGNYIEIRKNAGYIEIHNNEVCKFILNSKENQAFLHTERLYVDNAAGSITMTRNSKGETVTTGYFKKKVDDDENFVKITMGSVGAVAGDDYQINPETQAIESSDIIFSMNVCNKFALTIDTDGNLKTHSQNTQHSVEQDHVIEANGYIADMAVADIQHIKLDRQNFISLVDAATKGLAPYAPSKVNQVPPAAENPTEYTPPTASSGGYNEGTPPTIDPDTNPAPPPTEGGHIVVKAYEDWNAGKGRFGRRCIMTIYNQDNTVKGNYQCSNGPWGRGAIPFGNYTVRGLRHVTQKGMAIVDPSTGQAYGWKCLISDVYDKRVGAKRTLLRIHPDGGNLGTNGCFGIVGTIDIQKACYAHLKEVISENGGQCLLEYK